MTEKWTGRLLVCLAGWLLACPSPAPVRAQDGPIIVGTKFDYPPYSFSDDHGRPAGYNVELLRAVAEVMGLDIEVRVGPWDEIRTALQNGEIDAIAGMYYSADRDRQVDFSPPYTAVNHAVFVHQESPPIHSRDDLRGKSIIVMQGDIMHDFAVENGLTDRLTAVATQAEALQLLASGRHDCALIARLPGYFWAAELGLTGISATGLSLKPSHYCFAVAEGNHELQSHFAEGLAILADSGREREIYQEWLGVLQPPGIPRPVVLRLVLAVGVPALLLLLLLLLRGLLLRRQVTASARDLRERTKELACIYAVSEAVLRLETVEELLAETVRLLPPGWRDPAITRARIIFDGRAYLSEPFTMTEWFLSCPLVVEEERRGSLEVICLANRSGGQVGPFLASERNLIDTVGRLLSRAIQAKLMESRFRREKANYSLLFREMLNGFALHRIICDPLGRPVDYQFLDANPAFEKMTGLKAELIVGRTVKEILPGIEPLWIERYGKVALTGEPVAFQSYIHPLDKHFEVSAFQPEPNHFACIVADITQRRKIEESLAHQRVRLQSLASRLADTEELLRQEIAAGLHDTIGQDLAALKLKVDMLSQAGGGDRLAESEAMGAFLAGVSRTLDGVVQKIWSLAFQLSPPGLYEVGLLPALEWLADQFRERHGVEFHLDAAQVPGDLDRQARGVLFQMIRELATNSVKHGRPRRIEVGVARRESMLEVKVADDGAGFDADRALGGREGAAGFGLFGIRERLAFLSGWLEIVSAPGRGTVVTIHYPLTAEVVLDQDPDPAGRRS